MDNVIQFLSEHAYITINNKRLRVTHGGHYQIRAHINSLDWHSGQSTILGHTLITGVVRSLRSTAIEKFKKDFPFATRSSTD